jgi:hypothetical protein
VCSSIMHGHGTGVLNAEDARTADLFKGGTMLTNTEGRTFEQKVNRLDPKFGDGRSRRLPSKTYGCFLFGRVSFLRRTYHQSQIAVTRGIVYYGASSVKVKSTNLLLMHHSPSCTSLFVGIGKA